MILQELLVPLTMDDSAFGSGIEGAITKASSFGTFLGNMASSVVSGAFDLLGKGVDFVGNSLKNMVGEAASSQEALSQLEAVIKSTGGVAGVTSEQANELASALQKTTRFSDEQILSGESLLLTFTSIGKDIFPKATETILDMSQALGQDLKSSALQLGKALNDPIAGVSALRRVGVQFTDSQEEMIKSLVESGRLEEAQTMILKELQVEFGGSAEAAGKTFKGQLDILNNKLSDVKEKIGGAVLPILGTLTEKFSNLIDTPQVQQIINDVSGWLDDMGGKIEGWVNSPEFDTFMDNVLTGLSDTTSYITENLPKWIQNFSDFMKTINDVKDSISEFVKSSKKDFEDFKTSSKAETDAISLHWNEMISNMETLMRKFFGNTGISLIIDWKQVGISALQAIDIAIWIVNISILGWIDIIDAVKSKWYDFKNNVLPILSTIGSIAAIAFNPFVAVMNIVNTLISSIITGLYILSDLLLNLDFSGISSLDSSINGTTGGNSFLYSDSAFNRDYSYPMQNNSTNQPVTINYDEMGRVIGRVVAFELAKATA